MGSKNTTAVSQFSGSSPSANRTRKTLFLPSAAAVVCGIMITQVVHASVIVQNSDIANNSYSFSIVPTAQGRIGAALSQYADTLMNVQEAYYYYDGDLYARAVPGTSTAEILIHFDFSNTSFHPNSVTFTDEIDLFSNVSPQSTEESSSYSIDGSAFMPFEQVQNTTDQTLVSSNRTPATISFGQNVAGVWYEALYNIAPGSPSSTFLYDQTQWGRVPPSELGKEASFSAIFAAPEPASFSVLLLAGGMILNRRRSH